MPVEHEPLVKYGRQGAVASITLLRPTLNRQLKEELLEAVRRAGGDNSVRAVVLQGSGKAFCFGQDLAEHAQALRDGQLVSTVREHINPLVLALAELPVPVVAGVNGACVGAGLGIALAADLRVAAEGARFGTAFTGIGLASDAGLSASLVRAVGTARAAELFLLAELFSAQQALEWGLVQRVVADGEVEREATALAERLASGPTAAYAELKPLLHAVPTSELAEVLELEAAAQERLAVTADHRNAVDAFLNKQRPSFEGR